MIIKNVTQVGNSLIRGKAILIKNVESKTVKTLIKNLIDSMRYHNLVGMAANQIGSKLMVFVTEVRKTKLRKKVREYDNLRIYINPRITWKSGKKYIAYEGCGSVASAQVFGPVKRYYEITVTAKNEKGRPFKLKVKGLLARVIQHEIDHLNGIIFTDKLSNVKQIMSREEYLKK